MKRNQRSAYDAELAAASIAVSNGDFEVALGHLGRGHIISQRITGWHVHVHWLMLKVGFSIGDWREIFGQLSRIVAAALFSRIWVPVGNTGRANVSALKPMPIPDDLRSLMDTRVSNTSDGSGAHANGMKAANETAVARSLVLMALAALVMPKANSAGLMEEVVFTNNDVALSGTIHLPAGSAKAGIVLIHGSAKKDSFRMTALARLLADQGFAVFTYDKRGIGKSGGTFQDRDDERAFTVLAEDAVAAFKTFVNHPRVRSIPTGFLGISQGGWVGPIAASRLPSAAFMVLWSGPVCTVSEEVYFSAFAKQIPDFSIQKDRAKIRKHMESVPIRESDFDPRQVVTRLSLPVLWIFGGRDSSIPVELSIARLREMIEQGHRNFEFRLFPEQGHGLDYPTPYPNGYEFMVTWIEKAVTLAQQTAGERG